MKEPKFNFADGTEIAFSLGSTEWLRDVVAGNLPRSPNADTPNVGFAKQWAAIILQERGQ